MTPRFERRPEKRSGPPGDWRRSPAGRKPFTRGEGRPEGRAEGDRAEARRLEGRRLEGGRPEGRRFEAGRPESGRPQTGRFRGPRPEAGRFAGPRPEGGRFAGPRPDGGRFASPRFERPDPDGSARPAAGRRIDPRRPGAAPARGASPRGGDRLERGRGPRRFVAPRPEHGVRPRFNQPGTGARDQAGPTAVGDRLGITATPEADRFGQEPADDFVWGRHAAQASLESGRPIHRIWCTPEMRLSSRFLQLLREAKASGVLVEEVTWARLGQLTGGAVHQGIVLQTAAADTLDLATLIEGCRGLSEPALLMAVDGLTDPHNLGAIVRSAESLGAHGLVLPQRRCAGLTGTVAKVAAGALEHLPVARVVNLNRSLETLKQEGYRVIGLAEEGSVGLHEADLDGPLVVITGSEASGLSLLTRRSCDQLVRIPLRGATPSLNASVATALLLYEIARRGWMQGVSGTAPAPRIVRPVMPAQPDSAASLQEGSDQAEAAGSSVSELSPTPATALPLTDDLVEDLPPAPLHEAEAADLRPEPAASPDLLLDDPLPRFDGDIAL